MKIAIIGAGGIGGYIGGRLAQSGHEVTLVARGAHMQAIQENGLKIKSPHGDAHVEEARVTNDIESIGPVDVIFAAVKLPILRRLRAVSLLWSIRAHALSQRKTA